MALRASWKGVLKIAELTCPVALYTASSTSERIAFHTLNRKTGHRLHRQFVDSETGDVVEAEDQVKGFETEQGDYIRLEPEEIAEVLPDSDKVLSVETFIRFDDIDEIYFDRPYYLTPSAASAAEAFTLIREGMLVKKVAAIARTVIFRRMRSILIRPHAEGLIATTLDFDYEVRSASDAFSAVPSLEIEDEMLNLAKHIIETKAGRFDPATFDDRYESALAELVRAKLEGRKMRAPKPPKATKVIDLMTALRQSAGAGGSSPKGTKKRVAAARKKAS
jgi:DNA end-binding protein Ku